MTGVISKFSIFNYTIFDSDFFSENNSVKITHMLDQCKSEPVHSNQIFEIEKVTDVLRTNSLQNAYLESFQLLSCTIRVHGLFQTWILSNLCRKIWSVFPENNCHWSRFEFSSNFCLLFLQKIGIQNCKCLENSKSCHNSMFYTK